MKENLNFVASVEKVFHMQKENGVEIVKPEKRLCLQEMDCDKQ